MASRRLDLWQCFDRQTAAKVSSVPIGIQTGFDRWPLGGAPPASLPSQPLVRKNPLDARLAKFEKGA